MGDTYLPPWEPIAKWVYRHNEGENPTGDDIASHHETIAKAIAYDIAAHNQPQHEDVNPYIKKGGEHIAEKMKDDINIGAPQHD